jgi:hypothetical protein
VKGKRTSLDIKDFSGGLVTILPVTGLETKFTPDCVNVYGQGSKLVKRKGFVPINTDTVGAGQKVNGMFNWVKSASEQLFMAVFDNALYKMDSSGSAWDGTFDVVSADSALGTAFSDSITHFASYAGNLLFTTEARDKPQKILVTDASHKDIDAGGSGTAPNGKYIQVWKDHIWVLNIGAGGALTEEADSISAWTDNDSVGGTSSQTSFDGASTFRFLGGSSASENAKRTRDIGGLNDDYVVEMRTQMNTLSTITGGDYAEANFDNGVVRFDVRWSDDGLEVYNGSSWTEVSTNVVTEDTWVTWKFQLTAGTATAAVVDVFQDGSPIGLGIDISSASASTASDGVIDLFARAGGSGSTVDWYMDYMYINNSTAKTEYYTDGDYSEWTDKKTPTQATLPGLTLPNMHFALNDSYYDHVAQNIGNDGGDGEYYTFTQDTIVSSGKGLQTVFYSTPGKIGRAFNFDSSEKILMAADGASTSFRTDSSGSVAFWVYPNGAIDGQTLFNFGDANADSFCQIKGISGGVRLVIATASDVRYDTRSTTSLTTGAWNHVVVTQGSTSAQFYINGVLSANTDTDTTDVLAWMDNGGAGAIDRFTIGDSRYNSSEADYLNAYLKDVRYYQEVVLTSTEVAALYNGGTGSLGPHAQNDEAARRYLRNYRSGPAIWLRCNDDAATNVATNDGYLGNGVCYASTNTINSSTIALSTASGGLLAATTVAGSGASITLTSASVHNINLSSLTSTVCSNSHGTVSAWVFADGTEGGIIFSAGDDDVNTHIQFYLSDNQNVRLSFATAGGTQLQTNVATISTGSWHHLCWVGNNNIKTYVDGVVSAVVTTNAHAVANKWFANYGSAALDTLTVGALTKQTGTNGTTNPFNGRIDDFRYYERPLSESEVRAIYEIGLQNVTAAGTTTDTLASPNMPGMRTRMNPIDENVDYGMLSEMGTSALSSDDAHMVCGFIGKPNHGFKLEENAASTVVDDYGPAGTAADGTCSVNTSVVHEGTDNLVGTGCFSFTSASSHNINIDGAAVDMKAENNGSVSVWVKHSDHTADGVIWSLSEATTDTFVNVGVTSENKFFFRYRDRGSREWEMEELVSHSTANWYHVCLSHSSHGPYVTVNGELWTAADMSLSNWSSQVQWFSGLFSGSELIDTGRIGCLNKNNGGNTAFYNGLIDDVRFYDNHLSLSEIRSIYNAGTGTAGTGGEYRPLMRFNDLSAIPSDATIKSASMHLFTRIAGSGLTAATEYEVYQVKQDWTAASVNWASYDGASAWATAGAQGSADINTTACGSTGAVMIKNSTDRHNITIGLNSTGVKAIQDWADGTLTNNGFLLATATTTENNKMWFIGTKQDQIVETSNNHFPVYLDVSYTIPEQDEPFGARIGNDYYTTENFGNFQVISQTVASGTASLSGVPSYFGGWIKAEAGVTYKLRPLVSTVGTEIVSSDFTGDGSWQYQTLSFTPDSGLGSGDAVLAQVVQTKEGRVDIDQQSIVIQSTETTDDKSDRLQRSALALLDDWDGTDSGFNDIVTPGDRGLTGSFIISDRMYVTKARSIHRITYTGSVPLLDLKEIRSTLGTKSPRSMRNVSLPGAGEVVFFLGSDLRLYQFDGFDTAPISSSIENSNGISSYYMQNINAQALDKVHAVLHDDNPWYELFIPLGNDTACGHSLIYDYLAKAFWPNDNKNFRSSIQSDDGAGQRRAYVGATTSGFVSLTPSTTSDNGSAINANWTSPKVGDPTIMSQFDEVDVMHEMISGTPTFGWRDDFTTAYVTKTLSSGTNVNNYSPSLKDNFIQFNIVDNSTTEGFQIWQIREVSRGIGHGK